MSKRTFIALTLMYLVPAASVSAAGWQVDLDPERTTISFTLKATMHTVHGTANLAAGSLVIDPDTGAVGGEIVINAPSAETGNGSRDKKMHAKVLVSGEHPLIVLRPQHIQGNLTAGPDATVTLVGDLELLGKSHPIDITLDIRVDGSRFTAEAEFTIPYAEWGLKDPSTFVLRVAKEVRVQVSTEGTIKIENRDR